MEDAVNGTSEGAERNIEERVAVLEERTKQKPKSILDNVKEWGGIASVVIAIAYTFPLGVWDRFIVSENQKRAQQLEAVRSVILQSADLAADAGRTLPSISDPIFREQVARAFNTKNYILMSKNDDLIISRKDDLTAEEILVIGYGFVSMGEFGKALSLLDTAIGKAKSRGVYLMTEILTLKGRTLFFMGANLGFLSKGQKNAEAEGLYRDGRTTYVDALGLNPPSGMQRISSRVGVLSDWGRVELASGDWACGEYLMEQAGMLIRTYYFDNGASLNSLLAQRSAFNKRSDQPANGCDPSLLTRAGLQS